MWVGLSTILDRTIEFVGRVQKGLGGSRRDWKGLEGSLVGPGRIPGGSPEASLKKVDHYVTWWVPVLGG